MEAICLRQCRYGKASSTAIYCLFCPVVNKLCPQAHSQGNIVQIYNTFTMENVGNLKGHNGKVRSLCWSADDMRLVSCGLDGAIYEWSVQTFQRVSENVLKSCSYTCAVLSPTSNTVYAVGSDKTLKELNNCQIVNDIPSSNKANPAEVVLTQVLSSFLCSCSANQILRDFPFATQSHRRLYCQRPAACSLLARPTVRCDPCGCRLPILASGSPKRSVVSSSRTSPIPTSLHPPFLSRLTPGPLRLCIKDASLLR
jgi:WD40 repeat protein